MNTTKKIIFLLGIVFFFSMKVCAQTYQYDDFIVTCGGEEENMGDVHGCGQGIKRCYKISQNTEFTFTWYTQNTKIDEFGGVYVIGFYYSYNLTLDTYTVLKLTLTAGVYDMTFTFIPGDPEKMKVYIEHHKHNLSKKPTEATCTTAGYPVQCDGCKDWFWDENTPTYENDYKPILGHDFTDQTWTTDEVNGGKYRKCTRCDHKQYSYDVVPGEPALSITLKDDVTLTYPQSMSPVYAKDGMMWKVKLGKTTACELAQEQVNGISTQWLHKIKEHQCADKSWADGCTVEGCTEGFTKRWLIINDNKVETTATTGDLAIESLTLDDAKGYECEAKYTANAVSYSRAMSNEWGTLCLPFEIQSDQDATCKFYELKEVKEAEIVLTEVSGNIPAGTPVLVRRNAAGTDISLNATNAEGTDISLNATNAAITVAPAAGSTANGHSLVGRFTASEALTEDSYIINNNKFWRVSDLTSKEDVKDVKVGAFRAYLQSSGVQNVRMMSLSIGDDDTTAIDVLNAADEGEAEIYDLNGHRLQGLQKGMNIVKRGNKTTKVIIK